MSVPITPNRDGPETGPTEEGWRRLTPAERAILSLLLAQRFPGAAALRSQAEACRVRAIDADGSLALLPKGGEKAEIAQRPVPVEMQAEDSDGTTIHVLLHVRDGWLWELEIYKDDSSRIEKFPALKRFWPFVPG